MATGSGGSVSNAVLATKLDALNERFAHVLDELRALRSDSVGRELYDAHRAATDAELTRIREQCRTDTEKLARQLDAERAQRAKLRGQLVVTVVGGALGILAAFVAALVG